MVSIVIPVFNGENYLQEAIDSALAQTYPNIEIIVVNDGSKDNGATERIALSYGDKIRYFYKENGGVATALNLAIKEMKGEYFSWLSHDDLYYPYKIERQIQALFKEGDLTAIVQSDYDLLEIHSLKTSHVMLSNTYSMDQLTNSVFPVLQGLIHGCTLLIHKSHFERVGLFNENLITTQDYDLFFRMFRGQKTIYIAEALILGRLHNEQGSRTITSHQAERNQLHIDFLKELTEEEMCTMYGSPYNFYHRMSCFFKGIGMEETFRFANQKMQESDIPGNLYEQLLFLQKYIASLSEGKAEQICIFGAGEYGKRLVQELYSKLIFVSCFSDNDPSKWEKSFANVKCISPVLIEEEKERTLVIVANRTPEEIVSQLKSSGFSYITTKQELDKVLLHVPPVKWITALDNIDGVNYSSEGVQLLLNKFNQTIFDICQHYEKQQH